MGRSREQEIEALKKQYVDQQVADALYWERRNFNPTLGGGLLGAAVDLALLTYSLASPSKENFQEKVTVGALDHPKVRRQYEEMFNGFITDLSNEERTALTKSRSSIALVVNTYYIRRELISACNSDISRYETETNPKNVELFTQKLAATRALKIATVALPKVITDPSQVVAFKKTVATHAKVLEKNRDPSSKALAVAGCVAALLFPSIAAIAILGVLLVVTVKSSLSEPENKKANASESELTQDVGSISQLWRPRSALLVDKADKLVESTQKKLKK
jgi:hypothetical protein